MTPQTLSPNDLATLPASITMPPPTRTRRGRKRCPMLSEAVATASARNTATVALFGGLAAGRSMTLDLDVWMDVSRRLTSRWVLNDDGHGREYVRAGDSQSGAASLQPGNRPVATLARIVMSALPGDRVSHVNGDRLDLRRANLRLEPSRTGTATCG